MAFCGLLCGKPAVLDLPTSVSVALSVTVTLDDTVSGAALSSTEEEVAVTRVPHLARVVQREVVLASRASHCEVVSARAAPAPSPEGDARLTVEFRIKCTFDPQVPSGIATPEAADAWSRLLADSVAATFTAEGIQEAVVRDVPTVQHALVHLREYGAEDSTRHSSRNPRHSTLALRTSVHGDESNSQRESSVSARGTTSEP